MIDTGPAGLHTFDLGTVPASVTPPRTWRRAAWFTIVASAAALVALVSVTSFLVSPMRADSRITALPSLPDGPSPLIGTTQPSLDQFAGASPVAHEGAAAAVSGGPWGDTADGHPPTIATVPGVGPAVVDPAKLADLTRAYFAEVTSDVAAAAALTVAAAQDHAAAIIQHEYSDVSSIQVESISVDPRTGVTVSQLRLIHQNGTATVRQQTLRFTLDNDPKIKNAGN